MRLLFFNPENDLALAAGTSHYTPPASALQMAADLERLPLRWAKADDLILLRDGTLVRGHGSQPISHAESADGLLYSSLEYVLPWGWSPLLVKQLRELNVPTVLLPTDDEMEAYRAYSSRKTAVGLLARLQAGWDEAFACGTLVGTSAWCTSEEEAVEAIKAYGCQAILKAPWSGSGRGVHPVRQVPLSDKTVAWMRRTLHNQGGVEVEPLYDKVQDFAFEFWAEGGKVSYEGLSLFDTTAGGVYAGNLVASEDEKVRRLSRYVPQALVEETCGRLSAILSTSGLPRWYTGPLGVDLMIVATDTSFSIHPLVEINLRMTMGWVALQLTDELPPDEMGVFCIRQHDGRYQALLTENKESNKKNK